MTKLIWKNAGILTAIALFGVSASAKVVYDNSNTYLGSFTDSGNEEIGDQIHLSGSERTMTSFSFEYYLSPNASGNETAELFLRGLVGPPNGQTPGAILYDSGVFAIAKGFGTETASGTSVNLPASGDIVWTVAFSGIESGEQVGLLYYDPPTIGASSDDFWVKGVNGFGLFDTAGINDNFGARLVAVPDVGATLPLFAMACAFGAFVSKRSR